MLINRGLIIVAPTSDKYLATISSGIILLANVIFKFAQ